MRTIIIYKQNFVNSDVLLTFRYYDVLKQALHSDIHIARKNQTILSMVLPECPDDLKYLLPYLQRSSELKGREPLIAYYCNKSFYGNALSF